MFHNISNPKWFGNWSRLEDDYLGNGGTDIADNFTFSKMEKTGGLFGSIIRLATAFPACDPETGHATGAWKVACESIDLDEVPLSDIADMISGFDCETITDFRLFNTGAFDNTPWQAVGFDPETGESRSLTDGETARVEGYFTVISRPGSGAKAVDDIRHGITPGSYDISVESHDCTSGRNALAADAPARDAPGKDNQNIG